MENNKQFLTALNQHLSEVLSGHLELCDTLASPVHSEAGKHNSAIRELKVELEELMGILENASLGVQVNLKYIDEQIQAAIIEYNLNAQEQ